MIAQFASICESFITQHFYFLSTCTVVVAQYPCSHMLLTRRHPMRTSHTRIPLILLASLIIPSMTSPSVTFAGSQDKGNPVAPPSGVASTDSLDSVKSAYPLSRPSQSTPQPGPAWKTIGGTITRIKGEVYTVEDYEGNQIHLYVSRGTKHLRGQKKVGDRVRAEITRDGFANSIQ